MQSKLSVLMSRKWGGGTGGQKFHWGRPPWPPLEPPLSTAVGLSSAVALTVRFLRYSRFYAGMTLLGDCDL